MATKTWRLVVTELGGSAPLSDVSVEATNWMAAVKAGRAAIGEDGGVPTGASCAVAPDGKVTIHDPVARKSYVLTPGARTAEPKPAQPTAAQPPSAQPAPAQAAPTASAATSKPKKRLSTKTVAYNVNEQGPIVPPKQVPAGASGPAPAAAHSAPAPAPETAQPAAAQPAPAQPAAAQPAQPAAPSKPKKKLSTKTVAYNVNEQGPIPRPGEAAVGAGSAARASSGEPELELLAERGEDPSGETPLHYREKIFVAPKGTAADVAEDLIRARFGMLRAELDDKPPGKFFNLAVFDHRWQGRPEGPPIVTLQWKDWRGDPVIAFPARELAQQGPANQKAPSVPPPAAAPSAAPPSASPPAGAPAAATPPASAPPAATPPATAPPAATPPASAPPAASAPSPSPSQPSFPAPSSAPAAASAPPRRGRVPTDEQDIRLAKAFEASQDLFFLSTPVEGLEFAMRLLSELVPCEATSACLYDINTDEFRFVTLSGPGAEARQGEAVPNNSGLFGVAARRVGQVLIVEDATSDERFDPGVDGRVGLTAQSLMYMPLNHQGQLFGIVQLINRENRPTFTMADGDVTAYVGKQLAEFLQQARMSVDQLRRSSG